MSRVRVDLLDRSEFDEMTGVQHADVVGHLRDDPEVMADEQDRRADLVHEFLHEGEHLRLNRDVEGARGLVGDQQGGLGAQRDGDHDPLAHPSGELVGIQVQNRLGIVDSNQLQVVEDILHELLPMGRTQTLREAWEDSTEKRIPALHRGTPRVVVWFGDRKQRGRVAGFPHLPHGDRFGNLVEDPVRRVQGVDRLLEDHSDTGPPEKWEFPLGQLQDVDPAEQDSTGSDAGRRFREQARNRVGQRTLPGTRLPDDPDDTARRQLDGHIREGVERAGSDFVIHGEPLNVQHGLGHRAHASAATKAFAGRVDGIAAWTRARRLRGSRMSRRPSPNKLKARTVTKIAAPAERTVHGSVSRNRSYDSTIVPHSGTSNGTPMPTNEIVENVTITVPMSSVEYTRSG